MNVRALSLDHRHNLVAIPKHNVWGVARAAGQGEGDWAELSLKLRVVTREQFSGPIDELLFSLVRLRKLREANLGFWLGWFRGLRLGIGRAWRSSPPLLLELVG